MGKRSKGRQTAKTGGTAAHLVKKMQQRSKPKADDDQLYGDLDKFHGDHREVIRLNGQESGDSSDDNGDTHFAFDLDRDQDLLDDSEGSEEFDEFDDSDNDEEDEEDDLREVPLELRRAGDRFSSDDELVSLDGDEEDEEDEGGNDLNWGTSSKKYYMGDTADLDIGQDFEDAEDEAEAALEIERGQLRTLDEDDFAFDEFSSDDEDDRVSRRGRRDDSEDEDGAFAKGMSAAAQQRVSGDVGALLKDVEGTVDEVRGVLFPVLQALEEYQQRKLAGDIDDDDDEEEGEDGGKKQLVKEYLNVKAQLTSGYLLCFSLFLLLRSRKTPHLHKHPVMKALLEMRFLMERLEKLDKTLKPALEKVVRGEGQVNGRFLTDGGLAPRLDQFMDGEDDEDEEGGRGSSSQAIGRQMRLASVRYGKEDGEEDDTSGASKGKKMKKREREKMKLMMREVMHEFGDGPDVISSSTAAEGDEGTDRERGHRSLKELKEEEKERTAWEEERFTRTHASKKLQAELRRAQSQQGGMSTVRQLGSLSGVQWHEDYDDEDDNGGAGPDASGLSAADIEFLNRKRSQSESRKSKRQRMEDEEITSDEDGDYGRHVSSSSSSSQGGVRGVMREMMMNDDERENDEREARRREKMNRRRKDGPVPLPVDPRELDITNDGTRRASKKILKNRGLVPHKKKEDRNPRVKKRMKYEKALKRRKGQVREVKRLEGTYGGEETGVKGHVVRSRKF